MQTHHSHHRASVSTELAAFKMTPILPDCIAFEATMAEYQKQPSWLKAGLAWPAIRLSWSRVDDVKQRYARRW